MHAKAIFSDYLVGQLRNHITARADQVKYRIVPLGDKIFLAQSHQFSEEPLIDWAFQQLSARLAGTTLPEIKYEQSDFDTETTQQQLKRLLSLSSRQIARLVEQYCYLPQEFAEKASCGWLEVIIQKLGPYLRKEEHQAEWLKVLHHLVPALSEFSYDPTTDLAKSHEKIDLTASSLRIHLGEYSDFNEQKYATLLYLLGNRTVANFNAFQIDLDLHLTLELHLHGQAYYERGEQQHAPFNSLQEVNETLFSFLLIRLLVCIQNWQYFCEHKELHPVTRKGSTASSNLLSDSFHALFDLKCHASTEQVKFHCKKLPDDFSLHEKAITAIREILKLDEKVVVYDSKSGILQFNLSPLELANSLRKHQYYRVGCIVLWDEQGAMAMAFRQGYWGPGGHNPFPFIPLLGALSQTKDELNLRLAPTFDVNSVVLTPSAEQLMMVVFQAGSFVIEKSARKYCVLFNKPLMADHSEFLEGSEMLATTWSVRVNWLTLPNTASLEIYLKTEELSLQQALKQIPTFAALSLQLNAEIITPKQRYNRLVSLGFELADFEKPRFNYPGEKFAVITISANSRLLKDFLTALMRVLPAAAKPVRIYIIEPVAVTCILKTARNRLIMTA